MAITLTTSWQEIKNFTFNPGTGFQAIFYLDAKYSTQSQANNTTTVQTRLNCVVVQGSGGGNGYRFALSYSPTLEGSGYWGFATQTIMTGEEPIRHNDDGTKSITLSASMRVGYTGLDASMSATVNLPPIARYPMITSAPNFNDEESPTIAYSTTLGFSGATIQACIRTSTSGSALIPYKDVNVSNGSYTFELNETERNTLRNATPNSNNLTVYFTLRTTTADNQVFYSNSTGKTMSIVNANPTLEHTETETNTKVSALLGTTASTVVQNASIVRLVVVPTAKKGATIANVRADSGSYTGTDTTSPYQFDVTINTTGTIITRATDSRGNAGQVMMTKTLIVYTPVNINTWSMARENPTSSNIKLNLQATYYQQTFGSTANVPTVQWKLGSGSWNTIPSSNYTINNTNHTLTINNYTLSNALVYTSEGTFTLKISDKLTEDTQGNIKVLKGIPTFDYGEHDVNINGDLTISTTAGASPMNVKTQINNLTTNYNNIKGTKLWTNSNPTASFDGQAITLSSSDYDILEIFFYDYVTNQRMMSQRTIKGKSTNLNALFDYNSKMYMGKRLVTYTNATKLTFGGCSSIIDSNAISVATHNNWCVPVYVVGYKTGLF